MPSRKKKSEPPKVKTQVFASTSRSADNYNYSIFDVFPNPDVVLERIGKSAYEAYKDILIDDHVTAVMDSRESAVKQMNWKIIQGDSSDAVFQYTEDNFKALDIDEFISHILMANGWGMSPIEVKWNSKMVPGKFWVEKLMDRPARWFSFDQEGALKFLSKASPYLGEDIPKRKILLPRNKPTLDNPYGEALHSKCYWAVFFKRNGIKWWNQLVEKYGFPWLLAENSPNMSETETDDLLDELSNMVQDGVLLVPDITKIELKDSGAAAKPEMFQEICNYMNACISKLWLGQTLTTELTGDVGSYAASKTHQGVKDERKMSDQRMIEKTASELCKWICEVNFPNDVPCTFVLEEEASINKEEAERDAILSTSLGVRFTKQSISTRYHLNEDEFEIQEPTPEPEEPQPTKVDKEDEELTQPIDKHALFQKVRFKDQNSLDAGIDSLAASKRTLEISKTLIKPIEKFINNSDNYDDAIKGLSSVWPEMETEELEELLTTALLVSNTNGHLGGKAKT